MPKTTSFLSGDDFKLWRASRGVTQKELADRLGLTRKGVSHLELRGISKAQALALSAIDHGLKPWNPDADPLSSSQIEDLSAPLTKAVTEQRDTVGLLALQAARVDVLETLLEQERKRLRDIQADGLVNNAKYGMKSPARS